MVKAVYRYLYFSPFLLILPAIMFSVITPAQVVYSADKAKSGKSKDDVSSKSWRGFIIDVQKDGTIWINVGRNNGVMVGFVFEVIKGEKTVKDPSGKTYTIPGKKEATLEVVDSLDKISSVKVVEGRKIKKGDIVRLMSASGRKEAAKAEAAPEDTHIFFREGIVVETDKKKDRGIISIGEKAGLKRGDKFVAVREKEKITDPASGDVIRVKLEYAGVMEVISVGASLSDVKFTKNAKNIRKGDSVRRYTSAPSGVTAMPSGFRKIEINWKLQTDPEIKAFYIYRSQSADGQFIKAGEIRNADAVAFVDQHSEKHPVDDSTTYFYKVTTINIVGRESPESATVSAVSLGPPKPPAGLSASSGSIRSSHIKWSPHDNAEVAGYRIYRSESKDGEYKLIADIKGHKAVEYDDLNGGSKTTPKLEDSKTYYYSISTYSPYGSEGVKSDPVSATTSDPPAIPAGFEGKGWQANKVPLKWEAHPDDNVRGYFIYRAKAEEGPFLQIAKIKGREKTSYVDGGESGLFAKKKELKSSNLYFYRIQAYNRVDAKSEMSEVISVMTRPVPAPPENIKTAENRPREIPISWRKKPDIKIKSYQIFRSDTENGVFKKITEVPADKSYFLDQELKDGKTYYYKIRAMDKDKLEGELSEVISATTKKPPEAVKGLKWEVDRNEWLLKWDKNEEIDIDKYIIWRKKLFGWAKDGASKENFFTIKNVKKGKSAQYAVSAKDSDNLEGKRSDPLVVQIP
ncbi:hypothetical protein MNBD_NITROSPINAE04-1479 [hydrothermal vent metagenome]|uniref:Fibronectin type-III domain-containing protein n=1 Tax=hydrothermal vent metagenome TaxID=652676 RepID=A0A3B1BPW4_9ZZZZ